MIRVKNFRNKST